MAEGETGLGDNVVVRDQEWFRKARDAGRTDSRQLPVIRPDVLSRGEVMGLYPEFGSLVVYSQVRQEFIEEAGHPTAKH